MGGSPITSARAARCWWRSARNSRRRRACSARRWATSCRRARPTGSSKQAFRPQVTDVGRRHPVTSGSAGRTALRRRRSRNRCRSSQADLGPLVPRSSKATPNGGTTLMTGPDGEPLLIVDRVGEGRVAQLMSDQIWLWARGFEGGGPQAELLRRLAHWLMKEPELEEEHLEARIADGRLSVRRRSLVGEAGGGARSPIPPARRRRCGSKPAPTASPAARCAATQAGLWRVERRDAHRARRRRPAQSARVHRSAGDARPLARRWSRPPAAASPGSADGLPDAAARGAAADAAAGHGWLGVQRNQAHAVTGAGGGTAAAGSPAAGRRPWAVSAGAWWREGR